MFSSSAKKRERQMEEGLTEKRREEDRRGARDGQGEREGRERQTDRQRERVAGEECGPILEE